MTSRLLAFDWFNTLGNVRGFCTREELQSYADQIERNKTEWAPFELPERWREMPVFDDVVDGIARLQDCGHVAIFSNTPERLAYQMLRHNRISDVLVMPLENYEVSKPSPRAYQELAAWAFDMYDVRPHEITVVTANENFGDLEGAKAAGMQSVLIRGEQYPTLFDLAEAIE